MLFFVSSITALNQKYNHSILQQMAVLHELQKAGHKVVFVSHNRASQEIKKIKEEAYGFTFDEIFSLVEFDRGILDAKYGKTWKDYSESVADFIYSKYGKVDGYFVFGGLVSEAGGFISTNTKNQIDKEIPKKIVNFLSVKTSRCRTLQIFSYCSKYDVPIYHKYHDPAELSFEQSSIYPCKEIGLHGYSYKDIRGMQVYRYDSQQYHFMYDKEKLADADNCNNKKIYDFVFGAITITRTREDWLSIYFENLTQAFANSELSHRLYYTDKFKKRKEFKDRGEYLQELCQAKYTHVIMSCEKHQFSIYRFVEALYYDCLPLVLNKSNYHILKEFGVEEETLDQILVEDYTDIIPTIEKIEGENGKREALCKTLKSKIFDLSNFSAIPIPSI